MIGGGDGAAGMSDSWNDEDDWGGDDDGGGIASPAAAPAAATSKWSAPKAKANVVPKKNAKAPPRASPRSRASPRLSPARSADEPSDLSDSPQPTETIDDLLSMKARRQLPVAKKAIPPMRVSRGSARPLSKLKLAAVPPSAQGAAKAKATAEAKAKSAAISKPVMPKLEKPSYDFFAEMDLTPTYKSSVSSTAPRGGSVAKAKATPVRVAKAQTTPTPPATTSSFVRFVQFRSVVSSRDVASASSISRARALELTPLPTRLAHSLLPPLRVHCSSLPNRLRWTMRVTMTSAVRAGALARILIWATTTEGMNETVGRTYVPKRKERGNFDVRQDSTKVCTSRYRVLDVFYRKE